MAGQAARAYLLETTPELYNKAHLTPNEVTWGIGETITKPSFPFSALRFMNLPSLDRASADCVDKKMARGAKSICAITYDDVLRAASYNFEGEIFIDQGELVHSASGVFNKAFYLLANKIGIKTAFQIMVVANVKYWNPLTDFNEAACGVVFASNDLNIDINSVQSTFTKVGIDTTRCLSI